MVAEAEPTRPPYSWAARVGPLLTGLAIAVNLAINLVATSTPIEALTLARTQLVVVLGLAALSLGVSLLGFARTRNGVRRGRESAKVGIWISTGYIALTLIMNVAVVVAPAIDAWRTGAV